MSPLTILEVKQNFKLHKILLPKAAVLAAEKVNFDKIETLSGELKDLSPIKDDASALRVLKINKQQNMELVAPAGYPIMLEWVR